MAKLYFTPTSCGAASFIAAKKAGVRFDERNAVSLAEHKVVKNGQDFYEINPKGNVPAIVLDDGTLINENTGTLFWVAKKGDGVLGENATEEFQVLNTVGYLTSEVHPAFGPLFGYKGDEEGKKPLSEALFKRFEYLEREHLASDNGYLIGHTFTIADAYLYIMLNWTGLLNIGISKFDKLVAYKKKIGELEFVREAQAEMNSIQNDHEAQAKASTAEKDHAKHEHVAAHDVKPRYAKMYKSFKKSLLHRMKTLIRVFG